MSLYEPLGQKLPTSPCRWCGQPVVWVRVRTGDKTSQMIGLSSPAPVYRITGFDRGVEEASAERDDKAGVLHMATCREINRARATRVRQVISGRLR